MLKVKVWSTLKTHWREYPSILNRNEKGSDIRV